MGLTSLLTSCPAVSNPDLTCVKTIRNNMWDVVNDESLPHTDDLQKISATNLTITLQMRTKIIRMVVNSLLELYKVYLGWRQYDVI
jgi:hypothetical protein